MNKKEWAKLLDRVAKEIYEGKQKGLVDKDMIRLHAQELMAAIQQGYGANMDDTAISDTQYNTLYQLQTNCYHFSGAKNWNQLQEMSNLLTKDGEVVPFADFMKSVVAVDKTYNRAYLRAEYNHAKASGQMAGKWDQIIAEEDALPYLEYDAVLDERTREEHRVLDKIVRPVKDPFWKKYYPPNGWNCRCTVRQLDEFDAEDRHLDPLPKLPTIAPMFQNNVGEDGVAFSEKSSYFKTIPPATLASVLIIANLENEKNSVRRFELPFDGKGKIFSSNLVNIKATDYRTILDCCTHFAKQGSETEILPRFDVPYKNELYPQFYKGLKDTPYWGKCPDFRVGDKYYEFEGFEGEGRYEKMLGRGLKQSSHLVLLKTKETEKHLKKLIKFRKSTKQLINEIWIYEAGNIDLFYPYKTQ